MSRRPTPLVSLVTYAALLAVSIVVILPMVFLVSAAFKTQADFLESIFLPAGDGLFGIAWDRLTLGNFATLFDSEINIGRALLNSVLLASTTSAIATAACAAGGYALAIYQFTGRRLVEWGVLAALLIPPPLLIAPSYQWMFQLGLLDSYWGVVLPAAAPAFGVYLFRQAVIQSVPRSMIEAARLDGASEFTIFYGFGMPMVRPMIGAFVIITFLAMWNNFIAPQVILQSVDKQPLSVVIYLTQTSYYADYGLLMAGTLVSILPVMILFLVLQREFVSGLAMGASKDE